MSIYCGHLFYDFSWLLFRKWHICTFWSMTSPMKPTNTQGKLKTLLFSRIVVLGAYYGTMQFANFITLYTEEKARWTARSQWTQDHVRQCWGCCQERCLVWDRLSGALLWPGEKHKHLIDIQGVTNYDLLYFRKEMKEAHRKKLIAPVRTNFYKSPVGTRYRMSILENLPF